MQGSQENDETIGEMNVIPFIDICLVLLIIILMTSASQSDFMEVKLPDAETTDYRDMNLAVTLSVDKKGNFYFEESDEVISAKNLWTFLSTIPQNGPWSMLVIHADKETPYEYLFLAIQCAQALGCEDINLAVKTDESGEGEGAGAS